jgi:hypothetical protein
VAARESLHNGLQGFALTVEACHIDKGAKHGTFPVRRGLVSVRTPQKLPANGAGRLASQKDAELNAQTSSSEDRWLAARNVGGGKEGGQATGKSQSDPRCPNRGLGNLSLIR